MYTALFLIYLAGVSMWIKIGGTICYVVFFILSLVVSISKAQIERYTTDINIFWNTFKSIVRLPIACLFIVALVPNPNILYITAGLRVGQQALETKLGQKSLSALDAYLDRIIEDSTNKSEKK
jgi:hypothetical protein